MRVSLICRSLLLATLLPALGCPGSSTNDTSPSPSPPPRGNEIAAMALRRPAPPGHGNVDAAETAAARQPENATAQRALGLAYYSAGAYPPAANLLEKTVALAPDNALAWLYLGYARRAIGATPTASEALEKATRLPGLTALQRSDAFLEMGNIYYQTLGQEERAVELFQKSLRDNPAQGEASLALGTWHAAHSQRDMARTRFQEAVKHLPPGERRAEAFACLGRLAEDAGDATTAQKHYLAALKQDRNNAWARRRSERLKQRP